MVVAACAGDPDPSDPDDAAQHDIGDASSAVDSTGGADVQPSCVVGEPCDDGNACTGADSCNSDGVCTGTALVCEDNNPCTTDSCDPAKGCTFPKKIGLACDDGDKCTVGDKCTGGKCVPGEPKKCPDAEPCEIPGCDTETGACSAGKAKADGTACDTGHPCLVDGACSKQTDGKSTCVGKKKECDDKNPCTADSCGADGKCAHDGKAQDGNDCTDDDVCTVGDSCDGKGACEPGAAKKCDDGEACTKDSCDPAGKQSGVKGCQHVPDVGASCEDGSACTQGDACDDKGK